ncbi:MAG: thioredoxin family protein [Myxococcales bacterium]|nr:thioredoxin family protein [Myxococcales bacterium]
MLWTTAIVIAAPKIGAPAPTFELTDTHGKKHNLEHYKGKYVILEWLNHGCPFVAKHYKGNMQKLQRYAKSKGIVWFSIVSSAPGKQGHFPPAKANEITKQKKAEPLAVLLDPAGTVGKLYGAKTTPHMFLINPKGTLLYMGAIDSIRSTDVDDIAKAKNYVMAALNEAMAGKPVSTPVTRPYGCSVKYGN